MVFVEFPTRTRSPVLRRFLMSKPHLPRPLMFVEFPTQDTSG